jgi:hypothetical protein
MYSLMLSTTLADLAKSLNRLPTPERIVAAVRKLF